MLIAHCDTAYPIIDPEKLARLYDKMSISEKTMPKIRMNCQLQNIGEEKIKHCLVGNILSTKPVNRLGFIQNMSAIWETNKDVSIEILGGNRFIFHFREDKDKRRIMSGGPWHYAGSLIVLEEPKGVGEIEKLKFDKAIFWVQIHNIPILCMNRETAFFLGKKIGAVKDLDLGAAGDCLGSFIWIQVEVDVTRPLERGFFIDLDGTKPVMIYLMYKLLPDYCWDCGMLGHTKKECPSEDVNKILKMKLNMLTS